MSLIGGALTPLVGSDVGCDEFNSTSSPCPTLTPQIEVPEYLSPDKSGQPAGERDRPGILIGARGNFLNFLDLRLAGSGDSQPDSSLTPGVCEGARALSPKALCRGLPVQPKTPGPLLSTGSPRSPTGSPQPFDEFDRLFRVAEHAFPSSESVVSVVERAFNEDSRAPRHPLPSPLMTTTTKFRKFPLACAEQSSGKGEEMT